MTKEEILENAGIDLTEGIARMNGMRALYEKFLYRFPTDPNYPAMMDAIAAGDVDAAFKAAHALKGVAGNLSLNRLYKDLYPLVEELRAGSLANAETFLPTIRQDYADTTAALTETKDL